jgi:hypothetical protein
LHIPYFIPTGLYKQFIASRILTEGGNETILSAYGFSKGLKNSTFTGWIVELDLLQQVKGACHSCVTVRDVYGKEYKLAVTG